MRKALIVGIDDYPNAPLSGCVNDANKITALLRKHENKSRNFDCRVLTAETNTTVTITKASLKKAIKELFAGSPEIALLYFSGHGFLDDLGGYLVLQL